MNQFTPEEEALIQKLSGMPAESMDDSMLEVYLEKIQSMSPEERATAIGDMTRSYGEDRDDLRDELSRNYATFNKESPKGGMAGNNPFSVYVGAGPLAHITAGFEKYQAGKGIKEGRAEQKALNEQQAKSQAGMMSAYSDALRSETPKEKYDREQEEEYRRRMGQVGA